jgi:hypothetical protein
VIAVGAVEVAVVQPVIADVVEIEFAVAVVEGPDEGRAISG